MAAWLRVICSKTKQGAPINAVKQIPRTATACLASADEAISGGRDVSVHIPKPSNVKPNTAIAANRLNAAQRSLA